MLPTLTACRVIRKCSITDQNALELVDVYCLLARPCLNSVQSLDRTIQTPRTRLNK